MANETAEEILVSSFENESVEQHGTDDDGVIEVEMSEQNITVSSRNDSSMILKEKMGVSKRILCPQHYMTKGEIITVVSICDDASILHRIGIKNCSTDTIEVVGAIYY